MRKEKHLLAVAAVSGCFCLSKSFLKKFYFMSEKSFWMRIIGKKADKVVGNVEKRKKNFVRQLKKRNEQALYYVIDHYG